MSLPPSLKTAMTPFPYSIDGSATVAEARVLMEEHDVHHLPVTEGHELVGIVTSSAVMAVHADESGAQPTVRDIIIADVYVVELDEPLDRVLLTMAERHVGSAIVTRHGKLSGVFTWVDACRAFGDYLRENFPHPDDNDAA
jgi:acetoin utilization protein AcuB